MVKRTELFLTSIHSLRAIQVFNEASKLQCLHHANFVASVDAIDVLLGHHLAYEDSFLVYLPLGTGMYVHEILSYYSVPNSNKNFGFALTLHLRV